MRNARGRSCDFIMIRTSVTSMQRVSQSWSAWASTCFLLLMPIFPPSALSVARRSPISHSWCEHMSSPACLGIPLQRHPVLDYQREREKDITDQPGRGTVLDMKRVSLTQTTPAPRLDPYSRPCR